MATAAASAASIAAAPRQVKIFDTTLRDGEQAPGCSMNLDEKLEVARQLELLGVDVIEAGFAISSPGDFESVKAIAGMVKNATIASLSRAVDKDIDASYEALRGATSPRIHLFLATSPVHMEYKLRKTPEQVLETSAAMVRYAKKLCADIEFSAEDATRSDRDLLVRVITEVIRAGATTVNIPDTVGYATPQEMHDLIVYLREQVPNIDQAEISVHCHNDLGMAVANSLGGVLGGATQVEVAINGIGERAGNAALEEVVMALKTRADSYNAVTRVDSSQIHRASRLIYNIIGQAAPLNKAIVGSNAFLHEAGIHQHGVLANRATYEIMTPESVGIQTSSMVLGKHSGSHAFEARLKELGHSFTADEIKEFFERFKEVADKKKVVTDSDIEAIVTNRVRAENHHFKLETFNVHSGRSEKSSAMGFIRLSRQGQIYQEISLGDGPVDAAFGAIDKIIQAPEHELETYLIQSTSDGADSLGEAVIRLRSGDKLISGRGLSTDVIESSILAYLNAMNKLTT